jgi:hypothetical protein
LGEEKDVEDNISTEGKKMFSAWRKPHNEDNIYSSPYIIRMTKSGRMR